MSKEDSHYTRMMRLYHHSAGKRKHWKERMAETARINNWH